MANSSLGSMSNDGDQSAESTIKLVVGSEKRVFEVSENLICTQCPFFYNAFSGGFLEARTKTFTLPDDDPQSFEELVSWLSGSPVPNKDQSWLALSKTWCFADKYLVDKLQNDIIDTLYAKFAEREDGINISYETLDFIADQTAQNPSSPLRLFFSDMLSNGISLQHLPHRLEQIPVEFLQDMCLALKKSVYAHSPANVALLTNPISTYYSSSIDVKLSARPTSPPPVSQQSSNIVCEGPRCRDKGLEESFIRGVMHIDLDFSNLTLCHACRNSYPNSFKKKMFTFTTSPYRDGVVGASTVVDGHFNDSGFYCDGPRCNPDERRIEDPWALHSGDQYRCLDCNNGFCTHCIRGPLECKEQGHDFLRIRASYARTVPLTEEIGVKLRQEREKRKACWRCGSEEHSTGRCKEKAVVGDDVAVED